MTTLPPSYADCLEIRRLQTTWNPQGLNRPVQGFLSVLYSFHTMHLWCLWISEEPTIISLYNHNWLTFVTEVESVYCAVRTGSLNKTVYVSLLMGKIPFKSQVIGLIQYDESLNYGTVKSTNARNCMKVYNRPNKHNITPTYYGLSCAHPQRGELQRMDTSRNYKICIILCAVLVYLQYPIAHCKVMEHLKLIMKCLISL
jgi:hypothetical protein